MKTATILVDDTLTSENFNWGYTSDIGNTYSEQELKALPSYKSCTAPLSNMAYKVKTWKPTINLDKGDEG